MNSFLEGNHFVSNIKSISRVRNEIATTIHRNRPFHGLVLFTKGESVFKFQDGNTYFIKENQVIYLPKFSNYDSKDAENTECIAINFDIDDSNATFPVFCLSQEVGERYRHKFSKGFHLWSEHGTGYIHGSLSVLYDIIYQIQKDASRQYVSSRQSLFVDEATTFIHMHLTDHKLSVEMISQSLQITPEYLRRLFKAAKGISSGRWSLPGYAPTKPRHRCWRRRACATRK